VPHLRTVAGFLKRPSFAKPLSLLLVASKEEEEIAEGKAVAIAAHRTVRAKEVLFAALCAQPDTIVGNGRIPGRHLFIVWPPNGVENAERQGYRHQHCKDAALAISKPSYGSLLAAILLDPGNVDPSRSLPGRFHAYTRSPGDLWLALRSLPLQGSK